jgi:hypothetical protein
MPRKEELNEDYLIRRVEETGGKTRKVKWTGRRGAPDRFVGWPPRPLKFGKYPDGRQIMPDAETDGVSAFVELKEANQPWGLQPHQRREIEWLKACGQRVAVLETKEQIDEFIRFHTGQ